MDKDKDYSKDYTDEELILIAKGILKQKQEALLRARAYSQATRTLIKIHKEEFEALVNQNWKGYPRRNPIEKS